MSPRSGTFIVSVQFFYYDMYRVMQDIIRERRSCRNVFEVLDFICIDYELYMKARLVNLATGRSQYRNAFGLQVKEIQHGISEICRVGESAVFVMMQKDIRNKYEVTVDMISGACSQCSVSKVCAHVSAVACIFPESTVRTLL